MIAGAELRKTTARFAPRSRAIPEGKPAPRAFALSSWGAAVCVHVALLACAATLTAAVTHRAHRGPELSPIRLELGGTGTAGSPARESSREAVASRRPAISGMPAGEFDAAAPPNLADPAAMLEGASAGDERASQDDLMAGYLPGTRSHGRPGDGRGLRVSRGEPGGEVAAESAVAPGGGGPVATAGAGGDPVGVGDGGERGDGWARRRGGRLPQYPAAARRRGLEGTVTLVLEVASDGAVQRVEVQESSGHRLLDDAATEAARTWTFAPATRDGQLVASRVSMPVTFRLTD